jgi:hypothetical protein
MYKKTLLAGLFLLLANPSVPSRAEEFEEDFMQTVEDTHKSLSSNLAVQSAESATTDVKLLEGYFAEIEDHFVKKGDAQEGVDLSRKSRELLAEILKTVAANDFDTASKASAELGRTCKECHRLYKTD